MLSNNLIPSEEAFNGIIAIAKPTEFEDILKKMSSAGVAPSVRTFNACLTAVSKLQDFSQQWKWIREILGEMKALGIMPTLSTYSFVLEIVVPPFEDETKQVSTEQLQTGVNILNEILLKLEMGPSVGVLDTTDQYFFLNAVRVAINANNEQLVDRVEKLYSDRKNTVAMTALTTESVFYSRFLNFKAKTLPLDALEKLYKEMVPRVVGKLARRWLTRHADNLIYFRYNSFLDIYLNRKTLT